MSKQTDAPILAKVPANTALGALLRLDMQAAEPVALPTTVTHEEAMSALQHEYLTEIRSLAEECVREHYDPETQEPRDEDEVQTWLHETIDGHHDVIYTHCARLVLVLSDNPDAYEDEMGEPATGVSAAAYWAMRADVQDMLGNSYLLDEVCGEMLKAKGGDNE